MHERARTGGRGTPGTDLTSARAGARRQGTRGGPAAPGRSGITPPETRHNVVVNGLIRLLEHGPGNAARHLVYWCSEIFYEVHFGISTRKPANLTDHGYDDDEYVNYETPAYRTLLRAFSRLEVRPGRSVFLDYGCGRGRALTVAATLPFRRVIGVELVPELLESARHNFARARGLRCHDSELVHANAIDYAPPAEVDHIYFFNPFRGPILEKVVGAIDRSFRAAPRPLTIVYLNPDAFSAHAARLDWLRPVESFRSYPDTDVVIYRARGV